MLRYNVNFVFQKAIFIAISTTILTVTLMYTNLAQLKNIFAVKFQIHRLGGIVTGFEGKGSLTIFHKFCP